jgi:hypothetical protein
MNNLTLQLRRASLLSLIMLACSAAYSQITPLGDTYTSSADPTTNYGAQKTLDVDAAKEITYIQFNLASVPSGASISQATLKLYVNTVSTAGAFELYAVNGAWTESALTYSIAPALGSVIDSNVPITTADKNQYILVPMTATVQGWLTTPSSNNGIALVAVGSFNATFDSKETTTTSHPPELDIVFAGGSGGITGINTAAGSGLIGGGTSGTLNLSLTNTCAKNQVLQWSGSAWACASAGTGTITGVTAGTDLTGGGTSGNVTLSLNTTATNALYAQLGAANTFTKNQTVDGTVTASSSSGDSILGISNSASGTGVAALNSATTGTGAIAVLAQSTSTAGGIAMVGQTAGEDYYYLTNGAVGVEGGTNSPAGAGMWGLNTASTGLAMGVYGYTGSATGTGVYGQSVKASAEGAATDGGFYPMGVWGDTGEQYGFGAFGSADDGWAFVGYNKSPSGFSTVWFENDETNDSSAQVLFAYGSGFGGECNSTVSGNFSCSGSFEEVTPVGGGARKVALNAIHTPESWFEDAGSGQLSGGEAVVSIESVFGETINTGVEYHVFLTPDGDCKGLYVAQKSAGSFVVKELGGGTSNIAFDYRIMAKRKGFEQVRLADRTKAFSLENRPIKPTGSAAKHAPSGQHAPPPELILPKAPSPHAALLPHPPALASKAEVNQK